MYTGGGIVENYVENPYKWKSVAQDCAIAAVRESSPRLRQEHWDAKNIRTASCRLTIQENERFKRCCRKAGATRYAVIRYMIAVFCSVMEREGTRWKAHL